MAGERVRSARLTRSGIDGDRIVHVENRGRVITSRTHPGLLGFHAKLGADGVPMVDGKPWTDASVLGEVRRVAGPGAELVRDESLERFDVLPLLVATDGSLAAFGRDPRRLRPNIVIGGVEGLAERGWEEGFLTIGEVLLSVQDLRGRCVMTTFDPDTLKQDLNVLRDIVKRFEGKLALNCAVPGGGEIVEGQEVLWHAEEPAMHA
jgi:hypothetical protein